MVGVDPPPQPKQKMMSEQQRVVLQCNDKEQENILSTRPEALELQHRVTANSHPELLNARAI
jgi:hypothetical protein